MSTTRKPGTRHRTQDVDRHVGARMRQRRIECGFTQQQFAELIGVTYQQAHKYEKGTNRVAAGRLYDVSKALGVGIDYFFLDLPPVQPLPKAERAVLELCRHASQIKEPWARECLTDAVRALAKIR